MERHFLDTFSGHRVLFVKQFPNPDFTTTTVKLLEFAQVEDQMEVGLRVVCVCVSQHQAMRACTESVEHILLDFI